MSRLALRSLRPFHRTLASVAPGPPPAQATTPFEVFDRNAKRRQRDRAAVRDGGEKSRVTDYLRSEVADRMAERFEDLRNPPGKILDLSSSSGHLSKLLTALQSTKEIRMMDMSVFPRRTVIDEEQLLSAVDEGRQDCIVSNMGLHWVNDLPGVLKQIQRALKPDGVFMGSMIGGDTLFELRTALQLAEQEREGGISPRISPMADPSDASNLMGRAGFALLTVDVEDVKINYPSIWELMEDLRDMGESNAVLGRRPFIKRDVLLAADAIYKELHGLEDGTIPATFQVIFLIGWKPSPNQPKPLPRGSGQTSLKDVL
ncbi:hypothetical protein QFC20_007140 [Naganishia adeliensis]|uniref:Uncharacterized protein n=1 Tax=Naganishia adeliensis TaxID=92952 RepID=A0ACC2V3Z8_9TREE|nr:hypothetical protein QFC20_007140 [Naganishia adeliensis]